LRLPLLVEAPVYGWERLVLLKHLLDHGLSKSAIARQLDVSRRTVYHWITTGQLERDLTGSSPRVRAGRPRKLAPYQPIITTRLATYPQLSAVRLFEEIRAAGYPGGITQLREYVADVRPRPEAEPVVRFETPPGLQAQVDLAECRFPWGKRFGLLVVLGYSRLLWLRFYPQQTMARVIEGLEGAFQYFGGVPHELLFDQMKTVILEDHRPDGGRLLENAEFLRFAAHWGFRIRACRPYRARTKGKVERPISYVRGNLLYGREFLGDADLAAQAERWLEQTANARVHGTTGVVPRERFEQEERPALLPLAPRPYRALGSLPATRPLHAAPSPRIYPLLTVERRPLAAYAALVEAGV
jgi:transposase